MRREIVVGILLSLVLLSSGCILNKGGSTGLEVGPGGKTITITEHSIRPQEILAGSNTNIRLGFANTGTMNAEVSVGEDGKEILTNYCPDLFKIQSFNAYSSSTAREKKKYVLEPGEKLKTSWSLKNVNTQKVPTYGYKCPIDMQVGFNYSVEAYQQFEVKQNREVQGATGFASRTTEGPVTINVEMLGSTTQGEPSFIEGEDLEVLVELENNKPEESSYQGLINLGKMKLESSEDYKIEGDSCNLDTNKDFDTHKLTIQEQLRVGGERSRVVRCKIEPSGSIDQPSVRGQITAKINYTYVKDLGSTNLEIRYRGN
ncbi:MAG: hypothetical protein ABEJ93_01085 [Candidatus Nanohalobium sp.]